MEPMMSLTDSHGNTFECEVVARWEDGNNYIAYTNGTSENDELNLFISKYIIDNEEVKLIPIEDDAEWDRVNAFLDSILEEGEDE